jgi:hypothetical protein
MKKLILIGLLVPGMALADGFTFYHDQYGNASGSAIQSGDFIFYHDQYGNPTGNAIYMGGGMWQLHDQYDNPSGTAIQMPNDE